NLVHIASYDYERGSHAEITVSADRDTYKPGEAALVTVSAPELAGGTVLVSVVDEACFALGENNSDPGDYFRFGRHWGEHYILPSVTRSVDGISLLSLLSAGGELLYDAALEDEVVAEEAAPTTGGGDMLSDGASGYVREDFLDNAAFTTLTLDKNGQAQARIQVPDNITTWRLTAIGFAGTGTAADSALHTSGVRYGIGVGSTVCTLPFFLNVTIPDLFLTQDEISFSARAAGTARAVDPAASVQYRAQLLDEAFAEIASGEVTAAAKDTAWFHFDTLPAGEYTVQVSGSLASGEQDAVRLTFRVAETAQIVDTRKTLSLSELSSLSPAAYPLTLTFYDGTDRLYYDTLDALSYLGTRRTDAMAAAYAALTADADSGDVWYGEDARDRAAKIRSELSDYYYGFLPLNQYAEGDCILTAEILYASPDALTAAKKTQLIPFFEEVLSDTDAAEEEVAASLMALASLGEPVLDRLYNTAQYAANASTAAKLYLSAGFAAAGDLGAAETLWNSIRTTLGRTMQGDAFCISDASTEEAIRLTALGLLPASVLDPDTACGMVRYLSNHTSSVDLHVLELAAFITYYAPTAAGETAFTFGLRDSDPITVTLQRGQRYSISLTKSDFEAFSILSADDGIFARAAYGAAPEDARMTVDEVLTLRKTVEPYDAKNGIYRVTVHFSGVSDADHMYFSLSDTIPAGARYFAMDRSSTYANMCSAYLYNTGGQQMKGSIIVYNPTLYDKDSLAGTQQYEISGAISYYIRGAVKGTFLAEPALAL
ncbi:MAG: hypothetical protein IJ302_02460, partial [Clostridia bacterium]|nr:hypothetical protein [Clostridia bacterium]